MGKHKFQEVIDKTKKELGKAYELIVGTEEGDVCFILKPLDRVTYQAASKLYEVDNLKAIETYLRGMYAGGDKLEPFLSDFENIRSAEIPLSEIIRTKGGNGRKL